MKHVLLMLFVTTSCTLQAQIEKGNFLAGGTLSFRSTNYSTGNSKTSAWNFTPGGGYFIIDKMALGARITYSYNSNDGDSYSDLLGGPFARYYFLSNEKKTNVFLEADYQLGTEKYQDMDAVGKSQIGLAAGPAFFVNPFIAIETIISWRSLKYKEAEGRYNTFGIGIGFQLHFQCKKTKEGK